MSTRQPPARMQAWIYERYGPPEVLELRELATPAPKDNEVLIRIRATTVSAADSRVRALAMPRGFGWIAPLIFGIAKPRQPVLGSELAGDIVAIGARVTQFKVGDAVFAFNGVRMGAHAQYRCLPQDTAIAMKPVHLGYDAAAALSFGGSTALDFLRRAKLTRGERVLVNGASGAVGCAVVQLAKHSGAHVTAVCSGANAALVASLGADSLIDYTQQDFTRNGERYDVIVDTAGSAPYARSKGSLNAGGRLAAVSCELPEMLRAPWVSIATRHKIFVGPAAERAADLRELAALAQAGHFKTVIDRRYPFAEMVQAHRYVDSGRKRGNVVITLPD